MSIMPKQTKEEKNRRRRERYHQNKAQINAARRARQATNDAQRVAANEARRTQRATSRDAYNANQRENYHANRDNRAANQRLRYHANQERMAANQRERYHENQEHMAANQRVRYHENRDSRVTAQRNRRQNRRENAYASLNLDENNFVVTEEQLQWIEARLREEAEDPRKRKGGVLSSFHKNPLQALLLFYHNSGCTRFFEWRYYSQAHTGQPLPVEDIASEVMKEALSDIEIEAMVKRFSTEHNYAPKVVYACCACGIKSYQETYSFHDITSETVQKFLYTVEDQALMLERLECAPTTKIYTSSTTSKMVNPWEAVSYHMSDSGHLYHLHRELVSSTMHPGKETVILCSDCSKHREKEGNTVLPKRCIAAGVDFGSYHRLGLVSLNLHEQCLLSPIRLYMTVYKISSNTQGRVNSDVHTGSKSHAIMFGHDAISVVGRTLTRQFELFSEEDMRESIRVVFVDDQQKYDHMAHRIMGSAHLFGRWWQLISYLRCMKVLDPYFADVAVLDEAELKRRCSNTITSVLEDAEILDDHDVVQREAAVGSDTTQTVQQEVPNQPNGTVGESVPDPYTCSPPRVSFVMNNGHASQRNKHDGTNYPFLNALARLTNNSGNPEAPEETTDSAQSVDPDNDESGTSESEEATESDNMSDDLDDRVRQIQEIVNAQEGRTQRETLPINDFFEKRLLERAFPVTFLLGRAYGTKGGVLSSPDLQHLLRQFTNIPATDMRLLGYLEDVQTRFETVEGVNAHVKSNKNAVSAVSDLLHNDLAKAELHTAINHPRSQLAKKVLKKYFPHVHFSGRNISHHTFESARFKAECLESCRRYGAPNAFLTLSFNMIDNARAFRCTFRHVSNDAFPAAFEDGSLFGNSPSEFLQKLRMFSHEVDAQEYAPANLNRSARAKAAMQSPVAYVDETKTLLGHVLSILLGMPPEHFFDRFSVASRRSTTPVVYHKGILGIGNAVLGVIEDHARGTLHTHLLCFGGVSPFVLQQYANVPAISAQIVKVLDQQYQTRLPNDALLGQVVKDYVKYKVPGVGKNCAFASILKYPSLDLERVFDTLQDRPIMQNIRSISQSTAGNKYHKHTFTCEHGTMGKSGCRLCYERDTIARTLAVLLKPNPDKPSDNKDSAIPSYLVCQIIPEEEPTFSLIDPIDPTLSENVVVWETARPKTNLFPDDQAMDQEQIIAMFENFLGGNIEFQNWEEFWKWLQELPIEELQEFYNHVSQQVTNANGMVPSFNDIISYTTASHNNLELLGSNGQASAAVFYICPYLAKMKLQLLECLEVIRDAAKHVVRYPSIASDTGTTSRSAKHVLQRVLNQLHLKKEMSVYQVVAKLLQLPSVITTETYAYLKPMAEITACIAQSHCNSSIGDFILTSAEYQALQTFPGDQTNHRIVDISSSEDETEDEEAVFDEDDSSSTSQCHYDDQNWAEVSEDDETNYSIREDMDEDDFSFIVPDDESCASDHSQSNIEENHTSVVASNTSEQENGAEISAEDLAHLTSVSTGLGPYKCYTVEKSSLPGKDIEVFVPYSLLYNNRGKDLRHFSRYELPALFQLKEKPKNDASRCGYFSLAPSFILSARYAYFLRQKQRTPLLTSKMPSHPGPPPDPITAEWQRKADNYARHILIVYRPEVDYYDAQLQINPYRYNYQALTEWVEALQRDQNVISKLRLMMVRRSTHRIRSTMVTKRMTCEYRGRKRKTWTKSANVFDYTPQQAEQFSHTEENFLPAELNPRQMKARLAKAQYLNGTRLALHQMETHTNTMQIDQGNPPKNPIFNSHNLTNDETKEQLTMQMMEMKHFVVPPAAADSNCDSPDSLDGNHAGVPFTASQENVELNAKQREIVDCVINALLYPETHGHLLPDITLLTGTAGTGKSEVIKVVRKDAQINTLANFRTGFNGITALHIGGMTTSSVLKFSEGNCSKKLRVLSAAERMKFQQDTGIGIHPEDGGTRLIIFDEVSTQAPWYLSNFSAACQQVTGCNKEFGGIPVLLVGDLGQMGPVKAGRNLTQSVADVLTREFKHMFTPGVHHRTRKQRKLTDEAQPQLDPNHPYRKGAEIMMAARWFELTEQCRAAEDPEHSANVQVFATRDIWKNTKLDIYADLSEDDLKTEEWARAPMIVATNHEKSLLMHPRACTFAKITGTVVIRWLAHCTSGQTLMGNVEEVCHYEYFVQGADGFFTDTFNKQLKLVNALAVKYHSLVPSTVADQIRIQEAVQRGDLLVTLDTPPHAINILLEEETVKATPRSVQQALRHFSISTEFVDDQQSIREVVLPISHKRSADPRTMLSLTSPLDAKLDKAILPHFPLEMNFAMTVNKAEGQTLPRVIIALSERPWHNFTYDGFYVSMSRSRHRDNVRKFIVGSTTEEKQNSIAYLEKLRADFTLSSYFEGYKRANPEIPWQQVQFDRSRAATFIVDHYYRPVVAGPLRDRLLNK